MATWKVPTRFLTHTNTLLFQENHVFDTQYLSIVVKPSWLQHVVAFLESAYMDSSMCMYVQAKGKEVESLSNIMKEKDDLMAQKQRQIDSLLAAIGARPAATGTIPFPFS